MTKKLTKPELIDVLVKDYGYEKDDIKMLTNAKLELMIKQEEADAKELEIQETIIVPKSKFKDEDLVFVMNGFGGALTHRSLSTGRRWDFREFGQTEKIPYSELLSIRNLNPKVFEDGWFIIMNQQIAEDFGLTELYKNILTPDNIKDVFNMNVEEMRVFVDGLPEGMMVTFITKARELYESKQLDSRAKIEFIQEKFGISLDDNAPLSDMV